MNVGEAVVRRKMQTLAALDTEFEYWRDHYQDLAAYILPRRYQWLGQYGPLGEAERGQRGRQRSERIKDGLGTRAARKLAAGMMGGITSPTRPWFRLGLAGAEKLGEEPVIVRRYLDEVQLRIQRVLSVSNFYETLSSQYLDVGVFGTSAFLCYEDPETFVRFYACPVGAFRLANDSRRSVNTFGRRFQMTVEQVVSRFGLANCSERVRESWTRGGNRLRELVSVCHLIEENDDREEALAPMYRYREFYWEKKETGGELLEAAGYEEKPMMCPRWELTGEDVYGTSPGMDALPDIMQLQQETVRKAQGIDKMVNPPLVADHAVKSWGTPSVVPGGVTFVPSGSAVGVKPLYEVSLPLGYLTEDISQVKIAIQETFYNDLFAMISQLQTVRSATEIDARQEEKLILLGPVLERFESEVLEPVITRVYRVLERRGVLPEPPPNLEGAEMQIQYVSILAEAQRAIGAGSLERWAQMLGNLGGIFPETHHVLDAREFMREYADILNVPARVLRTREEVDERLGAEQERLARQEAAAEGEQLAKTQALLADAEVTGLTEGAGA